jgi:hypothetical protein
MVIWSPPARDWFSHLCGCDARGKSIRDYPGQGKVLADFQLPRGGEAGSNRAEADDGEER